MTLMQLLIMFVYPAVVGLALGFFYYGVLWLVLRRLSQLKYAGAWFALSLLIRTLTVVLVLYLLFADSWQQLLIAVLGMLISRVMLVQRIRPGPHHLDKHTGQAQ